MSATLIGTLLALSLLDSTSIGTLFVPIGLLLRPGRIRVTGMLTYLVTIAVFYLVSGLVIAAGLDAMSGVLGTMVRSTVFAWAEVVAGIGLLVVSLRFVLVRRTAQRQPEQSSWDARIAKATGSPGTLIALALSVGILELATMVTFLAAVGMVTSAALPWPVAALLLTGYSLVMILPALVLLSLRVALSERVTPVLTRINRWFEKHTAAVTFVLMVIFGVLIARDGINRLLSGYR